MPRRRLTVAELKRRTTWSKLSRRAQLEMLAEEGTFFPGMPEMPPGLDPETEAAWRAVAGKLASMGKLATSDGDLIAQYLELLRVKNFEEAERVERYLLERNLELAQ